MSGFISSNMYNIVSENEISLILSHFSSEYIFDIIKDNIDKKFSYYHMNMPNIVSSYEHYFKQLLVEYSAPDDIRQIEVVRFETYKEIIQILCNRHNLTFDFNNDSIDYYSAAFYLYDLLISGYTRNLSTFFANYILKEKNGIYEYLNLNEFKKNKDSSTLYNKKAFKNPKVAIISANLDFVLDSMGGFDIPFNTVLNIIFADKNIVRFLDSIIQPKNDFFKDNYMMSLSSVLKPILLTDIRLEIQRGSLSEEYTLNMM